MQLVVLAGGFGTRLRGAIAEGLPKPMAPIAGRPFLEHLLDHAVAEDVKEVALLVGHGARVMVHHFGDSYRGLPITYSFEDVPLGTGGALKAARQHLADQFLFVNGDTFADVNYRELIDLLESAPLCLALAEIEDVTRYGSVRTEGDVVVGFREKGSSGSGLINAGVYACHRALLNLLPNQASFSFEVDFLEPKLPELHPRFLVVDSGIVDIGTPESYALAKSIFGR